MLNEKVASLLNEQINKEFYSAYLYLEFSAYFEDEGLDGFANWYKVQAQEERDHAMPYVPVSPRTTATARCWRALPRPTPPPTAGGGAQGGLAHEQYVTNLIHTIYDAAYEVKDFRTMQFLDWFVKEQGEEEKTAEDMIKKMELYGDDAKGLYMLNSELAGRTYAAPSLVL